MGQYHKVVNLDKLECIDPHGMGFGLKLLEQVGTRIGDALIVLLASSSNGEGGGDLPAGKIVGRWRGDRLAFVGDYDDKIKYSTPLGEMSGRDIYLAENWDDISSLLVPYLAELEEY